MRVLRREAAPSGGTGQALWLYTAPETSSCFTLLTPRDELTLYTAWLYAAVATSSWRQR